MTQAHGYVTCTHTYRMARSRDDWDAATATGVHVDETGSPGIATVSVCGFQASCIPDTFTLISADGMRDAEVTVRNGWTVHARIM